VPDDKRLDEFITREAKGYRAAGGPPADAMWSRIERDVTKAIQQKHHGLSRQWTWLAAGAGIAAALVIGIAIGRRSMVSVPGASVAESQVQNSGSSAVLVASREPRAAQSRAVTLSHLVQAEVFLTEVRADLATGRRDPHRAGRSRELLARTRLLMANGADRSAAVERLLQDLELVLAEIAALPDSGGRRSMDARLLDERLRAGTILPRIRTILPAPSATGGP
jgi:hypothetical protein